ncbi:hypothetical protein BU15DRAFT_60470 [Melanogaster broomeanus]|nr:hypothetical protein BU15DRAFT_60470 [Melanogaster broomeanus]
MARETRRTEESSDDDDAPEVVSHSTSKANVKRDHKALRDFQAEEKARQKARNRDRDQDLKERARATKAGRRVETSEGKRLLKKKPQAKGEEGEMKTVMRTVVTMVTEVEMESGEGEDDTDDDEFTGFGGVDLDDDMQSGSGSASEEDYSDDEDAEMSLGESDSGGEVDPEAPTDDEEMEGDSEDEEVAPRQTNVRRSNRDLKADYLADDLFTAAFSSQKSKQSSDKTSVESSKRQTLKKRRRKPTARSKDLVIDGRTIRTLSRASDSRSQATSRTVPPSRARKFIDQSLALKGKQALLKAKRRGWERRPANVGVMKFNGVPPLGFARSIQ